MTAVLVAILIAVDAAMVAVLVADWRSSRRGRRCPCGQHARYGPAPDADTMREG